MCPRALRSTAWIPEPENETAKREEPQDVQVSHANTLTDGMDCLGRLDTAQTA